MNGIIQQIKNRLNQLSSAEKRVGRYITEHPELVPSMTSKDLSIKADVSEASVVRFCKSIGAANFKTFKLELAKELTLAEEDLTNFASLQKADAPYDLFCKVTQLNKHAIESTLLSLDRKSFEKAVNDLRNADRIFFYGVGGSSIAAIDGSYKFSRLGYHSVMISDFHQAAATTPFLTASSVFIAISMSGKTKDVLQLAELARNKKACVIAITNAQHSPLYKIADIKLCTPPVEQDFRIGSIASTMTQLNIIGALYLSVFHQSSDHLVEQYREAREAVLRFRR
ncbi:MurR/RpiR family transcriptional regulator [Sporolactobacillus sp. CPB3-1]|uniref:MurR/RpiR family transcriptional regulator n=1 Tax=Sporolactobacillus mangiferae TaxID=2940498 RepID=A0ABT0M778_9BACL|nr:MurR/RpiR family transcriptional regulator [Sporolactobacillus mangiferae]MCL1630723.1 MurR/RpiR family transcriptional regulator [Sporolactobacillus mangiferae]